MGTLLLRSRIGAGRDGCCGFAFNVTAASISLCRNLALLRNLDLAAWAPIDACRGSRHNKGNQCAQPLELCLALRLGNICAFLCTDCDCRAAHPIRSRSAVRLQLADTIQGATLPPSHVPLRRSRPFRRRYDGLHGTPSAVKPYIEAFEACSECDNSVEVLLSLKATPNGVAVLENHAESRLCAGSKPLEKNYGYYSSPHRILCRCAKSIRGTSRFVVAKCIDRCEGEENPQATLGRSITVSPAEEAACPVAPAINGVFGNLGVDIHRIRSLRPGARQRSGDARLGCLSNIRSITNGRRTAPPPVENTPSRFLTPLTLSLSVSGKGISNWQETQAKAYSSSWDRLLLVVYNLYVTKLMYEFPT